MPMSRTEVHGLVKQDCESPAAMQPAAKKKVSIAFARFWAGATADALIDTILIDLKPYFEFEVSDSPQVLLYGPYSGTMPAGRFIKVFIGCENVRPIMSECDWAFGVLHPEYVNHPRYMRFARWGDDSHLLKVEKDWAAILRAKTRFCAFVYGNPFPYREAFFRALSRYKPVDAPGRAMNNMPGIDPVPGQIDWRAKVDFLRAYKFVIAFENGSSPGYNTEKLTHAIEADCVPIYWGDPEIGRSFNVRRFINAHDFLPKPGRFMPRLPYAPHAVKAPDRPTFLARAFRKFNSVGSEIEQRVWVANGFDALVDHVIAVDRDDALYLRYLQEPFFIGNRSPDRSAWIARWREIFAQI
jgi:alpha(1,3/1,4) fucosyltransferase